MSRSRLPLALMIGCALGCATPTAPAPRTFGLEATLDHVHPDGLLRNPTFSQVVIARNVSELAFISGQTAIQMDGSVPGVGQLDLQIQAALANLDRALTAVGARKRDVVNLRVYVVDYDPADLEMIADELRFFFETDEMPASTYSGVNALYNPDLLFQVDAVVAVPASAAAAR